MSESEGKKIKKVLALCIALLFVLGGSPLCSASDPQIASVPTAVQPATFQEGIEAAAAKAFQGLADELAPEIVGVITPDVEAISSGMEASVLAVQEEKETIETTGFVMDSSAYPPADVIARIPEQGLAKARAQVEGDLRESIAQDFAQSEAVITEQVVSLMKTAAPGLIRELEPALKALIPKMHSIIETRIEERIEQEILLVLPDLMTLIPDDMVDLSPEEIAAKLKPSIKVKVEAVVRPEFEAKIKEQVNALMIEKIKNPIETKFQPRLSGLDTSVYNQYIDGLPGYLERVIPKSSIKSIVSENVAALKARLPSIVESARGDLDAEINQYIENTIEKEAKVYISASYVKAPIQPTAVNNRLLVPFRAIATALGAQVEWRYRERQVVMTKGDTTIVLTIDSNVALVNGQEKSLDAQTQLIKDYYDESISHTVVPLRFIAETFDMKVDWQQDWKMVTIHEKD